MSRIAIYSHAPSDSVNALKQSMSEKGVNLVKMLRTGSTFFGRSDDLIINYGSSNFPMDNARHATILNRPECVEVASDKIQALEIMSDFGVNTVKFTTDIETARNWNEKVYARTKIKGHSGEGIIYCSGSLDNQSDIGGISVSSEIVEAPLYTAAIGVDRSEYRIHVMLDKITFIQQKRRKNGYRDNPDYSDVVRNYHTGWIYATSSVILSDSVKIQAVNAVRALGLDFGAVDVVVTDTNSYVLEVNTAPGMSGTNLDVYANNFIRLLNNEEVDGEIIPYKIEGEVVISDNELVTEELVSGGIYLANVHSFGRVVVRYLQQLNVFETIGFEDYIDPTNVEILEHLCTIN